MSLEGTREVPPYGPEWFRNRALASLKPIGNGTWDYSDSLLIYLPGADEEYEAIQEDESAYNRLVTVPERAYLESIANDLVSGLPNEFDYIDLGPGTEHKEQFVFDAARTQGKTFTYIPVDISEKYLRMAGKYAEAQGIAAVPLRAAFEEVAQKLGSAERPRFISLGLTYGNYESAQILEVLKGIAGPNGTTFINAHLRERTDIEALREIYADVVPGLVAEKMRLLGVHGDSIAAYDTTDEIRVWCQLAETPPALERRGVAPGNRFLVLQSLRPSLGDLQQALVAKFTNVRLFDTGGPFVGAALANS